MSTKQELLQRIREHTATVGVVGLGYVGLPLAVEKGRVGFRVIGIEQNPQRAAMVNRGQSYISDVPEEQVQDLVARGLLCAHEDFECAAEMDVVVICVPTPLTRNLTPDLQYVTRVTEALALHLRPGQLVSLESTTYPGTTEELMLPILESSGLRAEQDFWLVHSPERVDPGNKRYTTCNTNKVIGGVGPESLEVGTAFYAQTIQHVVPVSSAKVAELTKVFENIYRAVNIALVNEMALLCDRMGLSVWEMLDAAFTKPFGIQPFYPGPGVGGHCIPLDPHYLEWKARELHFNTRFVALAGEINRQMPLFVRDKAARALNRRGLAVSGSRLLLLGIAYKRDLADWRESPALEIMDLLRQDGAEVSYHDPHIPELDHRGERLRSVELSSETLASCDLVIVTTDHSGIDYQWVVDQTACVLDTRNATRGVTRGRDKLVLL